MKIQPDYEIFLERWKMHSVRYEVIDQPLHDFYQTIAGQIDLYNLRCDRYMGIFFLIRFLNPVYMGLTDW